MSQVQLNERSEVVWLSCFAWCRPTRRIVRWRKLTDLAKELATAFTVTVNSLHHYYSDKPRLFPRLSNCLQHSFARVVWKLDSQTGLRIVHGAKVPVERLFASVCEGHQWGVSAGRFVSLSYLQTAALVPRRITGQPNEVVKPFPWRS